MHRHRHRFLRARISAALLAAAANAATAAQAPTSNTDLETIQEVVITGSYIDGAAEDAALPVTVITEVDIEKQGAPSILDLIKGLSASQGTVGESNPGAVLRGSGAVSLNLRGLDAGRTLVLFNGRRLPISPVVLLGVDVNLLPLQAVGRIEVLKDGASSTYGSDAIAGVVNFISKRGFDGLSVEGSYTGIEDSDGDYSTNLVWGRNAENFDFLVGATYRHRSELQAIDRSFATPAVAGLGTTQGGFSASGNPGVLAIPPISRPTFVIDPGCQNLGGVPRPGAGATPPQCAFRFTQFQNLVEREEDYGLYGEFNTELGSFADLHIDAFYSVHDVPEENIAPSGPPTQGPGAAIQQRLGLPVDPGNAPNFFIPVANPGLQALFPSLTPAQVTAINTAGGVIGSGLLLRPLGPGGNPTTENEGIQRERRFDGFRFSTGLAGSLGSATFWDLSLTYGENKRRVRGPMFLTSNLQLALSGFGGNNCTGNTPGANGCLFFNPFSSGVAANVMTGQVNPPSGMGGTFNPNTVNSREVVDFLNATFVADETTDLLVADFVIDGTTNIKLPGGKLAYAVGAQYREDGFKRELNDLTNLAVTPCADSLVNPAATCQMPVGPFDFAAAEREIDVNTDVYGVFAELSLPVLQSVQVQVAFRYEDYGGGTGSTSNPKIAVRWQATDWLALRGSASSTFRGPVLTQAFTQPITTQQFVPQLGAVRSFDNFGNLNIKPEEADNLSAGFIVKTDNLSLSLDYFDINLKGKILNESGPDVVTAFLGAGPVMNNCGRAGFEALQARFTFVNDVCSPQNILRVRTNTINAPDERVKGLDLTAAYTWRNVIGGEVQVGLDSTYNLEYERDRFFIEGILVPTAGGRDFVGTRGGIQALPELRGSVFAEFSRSMHNVRLSGHYIDGVTDLQPGARNPDGSRTEVASYFTTDLVYRLNLPSNLTVTGAVFNLADRDPPRVKLLDYNYDPFFANPVGRAVKIALNKRFK